MPQLIQHIDAISRQKGRDVLFVRFGPVDKNATPLWIARVENATPHDWQDDANRNELIAWLEANAIAWEPCGIFASENTMCCYLGDIYVDVPFDKQNPSYQKLSLRLEDSDESPKIPGVTFCCLTHGNAMRNAHHDEPGFWERWAETF